jgi:hypothetical protein
MDPLKPSAALLSKLGSIVVHVDEIARPGGHKFDADAIAMLTRDPEVMAWREAMDKLALLPVMRGKS